MGFPKVDHEMHERRLGRNIGVGLLLAGFIGIVFVLTVVKVLSLEDITQMERFDHVARPQLEPSTGAVVAEEGEAGQ